MATIHETHESERLAASPPDESRQRREELILDAATQLLVRFGYRKTTIDDVAREAGVGKGTIYLRWKDKNELFRAAIWRASEQVTEDVKKRLAADPEGGKFHRLWTHGMLAILSNPLLAVLMQGRPDIFQGLVGSLGPDTLDKMVGNAEEHIVRLQEAGLIRADLSVSVITYIKGALNIGIINTPDLIGPEHLPSLERLAEALSDLIRRWLEPEHGGESDTGKAIMVEWLDTVQLIEQQDQQD